MDERKSGTSAEQGAADSFAVKAPTLSLPKGGGAIRGMGEKFAANPVTGTGALSVPIATSPGRGDFGPQLSLTYDSGAGNGPFGFGWSLALPAITRKTDKGLPQYRDAEASDVFMFLGAEDLVPVLVQTAGQWQRPPPQPCRVDSDDYLVDSYRPRIEGLFARIERWTHSSGKVHWRSISQDNILTLYGKDDNARICDPEDPGRIYSWLISESRDDKGNAVLYDYKAEDGEGVDLARAHERNRGGRTDVRRTAQRYLKRIRYGNRHTLLDAGGVRPPHLGAAQLAQVEWMFEVVFDYGEHDALAPRPHDAGPWVCRPDAFSSYRSGFELRSARLCQRVLMFHHFEGESGVGRDCLVRSTDFTYLNQQDRIYTFLHQVTQSSYQRRDGQGGGGYEKRSLPPLEFEYTRPIVQGTVQEIDPSSLDNLPMGVDGSAYQWTDLHGEGIPGILTEQSGAWYYKRNLSPLAERAVKFAPLESVLTRPNLSLDSAQFMDLAGKGQPDLVVMEGPTPGYFAHDTAEGWGTFHPFVSRLNRDMRDPNLRFIDLDGDGHADVLISEDEALVWHASLAEEGFGPARRVVQDLDEEKAPRLVFADGTQSIYLSDMSGDGLTDLVRIRNGEVCYWPNLGYGRFGAKVSMDHAPHFDHPDQFDQRRIRLADIDGSGSTDLIYLHRDGVRLYFNEAGNSWSGAQTLGAFPRVDDLASVVLADLLGSGTACLVWSSSLPGETRRQMRYVNLMGEHKPHLLVKTRNNLGAETEVEYVSSTRFYLQDRLAGQPWITRLPFPVHVVARTTVIDQWRNTRFSSTYSYHHGYFDGAEREFRGFARVEQVDVEHYGKFTQGNIASPYITDQHDLYQPPVKTVTWYHTGAALERERILSALKQEYFAVPGFAEHPLTEPTLTPADLSPEEWHEAVRACKGMVLRQESFELDVDALAQGREVPVRLYSTAYHNSDIRRLQPQGLNRHAVFLVTESEAITYHYELDLRQQQPAPDPRITHTLNLSLDAYGRVLQSVAAVYPRRLSYADPGHLLTTEQVELIRAVQGERHLAYTETHFCAELAADPHRHRLPAPCEVLSYELTGDDAASGFHPGAGGYFTRADFQAYALSETLPRQGSRSVTTLAYHQQAASCRAHRRLIEWVRMLYFKEDLSGPELFGTYAWPGLLYETYKLALTVDLLYRVFGTKLTPDVLARLNTTSLSGYTPGTALSAGFNGQWWIRSGIAGFASDAPQHFYLPEEYTDPFGNKTTLTYDPRDLYVCRSADALGNSSSVVKFDYRVLAPCELIDANANHSEVVFDVLGLPVAAALKGKDLGGGQWEGDDLSGFDFALCNPPAQVVEVFCASPVMDETTARAWLGRATTRFVYHFGGIQGQWQRRVSGACSIVREQHQNPGSPLQVSLECSDGLGSVLMKKLQAEPDPVTGATRWIVNGLTVLNNKGKPVKQYEPAFSPVFGCELPQARGVTSVVYYDAAGRVLRVEMPDGTFSRVEFTPWFSRSFDANDTVLESPWYRERGRDRFDPNRPLPINPVTGQLTANPDERAGWLAAQHAHTPAETHFDSLGREVIAIAHNRTQGVDEKYLTYTRLDAEGKPLWVRDARGNLVMQYITPAKANNDPDNTLPATAVPCYDIAGNLLFQHSMDAGERWMLMDAAGKPMLAWDVNDRGPGTALEQRMYQTDYDALHRPMAQWIVVDGGAPAQTEAFVYCDTGQIQGATDLDDARRRNLVGQAVRHYDASGLATVERMDLGGKPAHVTRTLIRPDAGRTSGWVDWSTDRTAALESDTFHQRTAYDALGRMTRLYHWHRGTGSRVAVYLPDYGERGLLRSESLVVGAVKRDDGYDGGTSLQAIVAQRHDAKGQREYLELGNGVRTVYEHDPQTLRLRRLRSTRSASETCGNGRVSLWVDHRVLQDLHYSYDPMGNITDLQDEAIATTYAANERVDALSRYVYDALYRLVSASGREHAAAAGQEQTPQIEALPCVADHTFRNYTQSYGYDAVGNILRMQHHARAGSWTRRYQYAFDDPGHQPASNRLWRTWQGSEAWDAGNATQKVVYQHDAHGSLLNLDSVPQDFRLHWDHCDMISSIHLGNGRAYYQYGADKQRSRKWIDRSVQQSGGNTQDISEERLYLGGLEIYRQRVNGILKQEIETLHLFDGEQRLLMVDQVHDLATGDALLPRYTLSNHLGSSTLELDEQARLISCEDYHPYGTSAYRSGRSEAEVKRKRYRYTGMERDEETGLSYHAARYYAPWLGRWGSTDPIDIQAGFNLYSYAKGNPCHYIDTSGENDYGWQKGASFISPDNSRFEGVLAHNDVLPEIRRRINSGEFFRADIEFPTNPGGAYFGKKPWSTGRVDLGVWGSTQGRHLFDLKPWGSRQNAAAQTRRYALYDKSGFSAKKGGRLLTDYAGDALDTVNVQGRGYLLLQSPNSLERINYYTYDIDPKPAQPPTVTRVVKTVPETKSPKPPVKLGSGVTLYPGGRKDIPDIGKAAKGLLAKNSEAKMLTRKTTLRSGGSYRGARVASAVTIGAGVAGILLSHPAIQNAIYGGIREALLGPPDPIPTNVDYLLSTNRSTPSDILVIRAAAADFIHLEVNRKWSDLERAAVNSQVDYFLSHGYFRNLKEG
jgi:RHS repeat-associated protein